MTRALYMMGGLCRCGHHGREHHKYENCQRHDCGCEKFVGTQVVPAAIPLKVRCSVCLHTFGVHIGIEWCGNQGRGCSCSGFRNPDYFEDPSNPPTPRPGGTGKCQHRNRNGDSHE